MFGFAPAQVQDLVLGQAEFWEVLMSLSRLSVSFWMLSLHSSNCTHSLMLSAGLLRLCSIPLPRWLTRTLPVLIPVRIPEECPSGLHGVLCTFIFLRWSQTWLSPTVRDPSFSLGIVDGALAVKTKAKKLRTSTFSLSHVIKSPVSFWRGPTFLLVFLLPPTYYRSFSCCPDIPVHI